MSEEETPDSNGVNTAPDEHNGAIEGAILTAGEESPPLDKEASIPPGILKQAPSYDKALDDVEVLDKKQMRSKKSSDLQSTKVVPVWYLFRFAKPLDIFMIILGAVMAVASGLALPGHMLMFGDIIDLFISFDIAGQLQSNSNLTCTQFQAIFGSEFSNTTNSSLMQPPSLGGANQTEYFCDQSNREDSNVFRYVTSCDLGDLLQSDIFLYTIYYLAMAGGLLIAAFLAIALWNWAAYRQTRVMRTIFFQSILQQDIGWFDVNPSGQLNTRLSDDIEKIQAGIGDKAAIFLLYFSTFISGFVIAFVTNWKMTLVVGTMLPVLAFLSAMIAKIVASFTVREQNAYASAGSVAEETLSSIRTVVAFGGEQKEVDRYEDHLNKAKGVGYRKGIITAIVTGALYFVMFTGYALGFWYGATLIADCEINPGKVITVFFGVVLGSFSLGNALPEIQTFATALGSATAVFAVIDRDPLIDASSDEGDTIDNLQGNIQFKDVCFTYPARPDVQILRGLDLEVKVGQTVALVGPSGCGKSTVIQLLQRFYNPDAGEIIIDGKEVSQLNLKWLRRNIGVVSQEPVLFNTTIKENIKYGKKDVSDEEIVAATKAANAFNFISELPDGLDTHVGQKGTQLSGGQKQRIAIARALVRDPKILLLDEATSALDTESEKVVQEALDKARQGRTTIIIAHRLSTIQTADVIAGIENGRIIEMGSHAELMDKEGLYYELVNAQTIQNEEEGSDDVISQFKASLRRQESRQSQNKRSRSGPSTSSQDGGLPRQMSNQSGGGEDVFTALTDHLSRYSIEDIPIAAHPSPALGRKFPTSPRELSPLATTVNSEEKVIAADIPTASDKGVHFNPETEEVLVKSARKESWLTKQKRIKQEKEEEVDTDADPLVEVTSKELMQLNKPDWYLVIIGVIATGVLGAIFPLMSILFSGMLELFSNLDPDALVRGAEIYAGYFVILACGAGTIQFIGVSTLSIAGERLTQRLRLQVFSAMLRQEMGWFDRKSNSTGALTARLAVDASDVKGATGLRLGTVFQTIAGIIAALVIALEASWILSLVLFTVFPMFVFMGIAQIKLLQGRSNRNKELAAESSKTANEAIDNIRTVASLGIERDFIEIYERQLLPPFRSNMKTVCIQAAVFGASQAAIFFIYSGGFSLGAFQVVQDPSSILYANYDEIFRVYAAIVFTALSIGRASSFAPDAQKAHLSASRVMTLLRRKPEIDGYDKDGLKPEKASGNIQLKDVHFTYPARPDVQVLQGLSLAVHPGETLALVGPSGCGKSTVVSLVERFYDIIAGCVEVDDNDIRDLNIRWLRSQIGIVSQEPVLFDKSIADNIRYGANFREVSDQEIVEAAKAANIHNFIQSLPEGYSTNVGSKGTQLSGGQKQRIAIARALVRDPKILLLDEATSALDTESEKVVQEALDKARQGRTCIVIAHRLSTIYNSDCISVIHKGSVIERGTHSELMAVGGAYYLLNTVQKSNDNEGTGL